MAVEKIAAREALSEGAPLWVIPGLGQSKWAERLDWYMNFLMVRESSHRRLTLPIELLKVIQEWNCEVPEIPSTEHRPLLMGCSHLLPAAQLARLEYSGDLKPWAKAAMDLALGIGATSLRVFLPSTVSYDQARSVWSHFDGKVALVEEPESWNFNVG